LTQCLGIKRINTDFRIWGKLEGKDNLDNQGVDGRIVLPWISRKWDGAWTELIWLRI
jgi:hypothetical protein